MVDLTIVEGDLADNSPLYGTVIRMTLDDGHGDIKDITLDLGKLGTSKCLYDTLDFLQLVRDRGYHLTMSD